MEQWEFNFNEFVIFYVKLINLSLFGEQRDFYVYYNVVSNENGVVIEINGLGIGGGDVFGEVFIFVNVG